MEENIYMLSDSEIRRRLGQKIRHLRLRQNFTQTSLAEQAQVSLTTLKRIEKGDISYFDSLMRVLRILGELDVFSPLWLTLTESLEIVVFMEKIAKLFL